MRIIDRLDEYIRFKGINDNQVTINAQLSTGLLNNARKNNNDLGKKAVEKILSFYQDLNRVWFVTGEGEMINSACETRAPSNIFPLKSDRVIQGTQKIPLYELTATAGLIAIFQDAVPVRGDSMTPVLKSGDIIIYKKMELSEDSILWGQIYLLSYSNESDCFTVVKYLRHSEKTGYVRLVSENSFYDPLEIPASSITALALVKASITFHTIE